MFASRFDATRTVRRYPSSVFPFASISYSIATFAFKVKTYAFALTFTVKTFTLKTNFAKEVNQTRYKITLQWYN